MKVFVYSKKTNKRIAIITKVTIVETSKITKTITIITESGEKFSFDTEEMKTTIYQN